MIKVLAAAAGAALALAPCTARAQGGTTPPPLDGAATVRYALAHAPVVLAKQAGDLHAHVARITELVRQGFYDGIVFHRVIDNFMAQTGDPTGTGMGGSGKKLTAEFSPAKHVRGTVSMARSSNPNSADSQFFICYADLPFLDGQYTIWGEVTDGMDVVDKIKKGEPVNNPDKIVSARIAE